MNQGLAEREPTTHFYVTPRLLLTAVTTVTIRLPGVKLS